VEDHGVLDHAQTRLTQIKPDYHYPPMDGYQTVSREMASRNFKAVAMSPKEFVRARFVTEFEDSGFIAGLPQK